MYRSGGCRLDEAREEGGMRIGRWIVDRVEGQEPERRGAIVTRRLVREGRGGVKFAK